MNQSETAGAQIPDIESSHLRTTYANFCRGLMTAEEIVLDFGFNPNNAGQVVNEQAELSSRIVMSPQSAVRLYQLLHALLAKRQEAMQAAQAAAGQPGDGGAREAPPQSQT